MKTKLLVLAAIFLLLAGCRKVVNLQAERDNLRMADSSFSALSGSNGVREAFEKFLDEKGTLLRPNAAPIIGKDNVSIFFRTQGLEKQSLTWKPTTLELSQSADLGYVYGIFQYKTDSILTIGTYVTIWKKDNRGQWRIVIYSENPGEAN